MKTGFLLSGDVAPGTDWIRRDDAYFFHGGRGTRPRAPVVRKLVGHWTGGEAGITSYDDDGPRVVRVMRSRKRDDGTPLNVGIHFVIGACGPDDEYASVWQTADPGRLATVHVGRGDINRDSVGVEVVSCGMPGDADVRKRPTQRVPLLGRQRIVSQFYGGQLRSWVRLAELLASMDGEGGIRIPRRVPAFGAQRRMTVAEVRAWAGAMEHLHVPGTTKIDAGGMLVRELETAGWVPVQP